MSYPCCIINIPDVTTLRNHYEIFLRCIKQNFQQNVDFDFFYLQNKKTRQFCQLIWNGPCILLHLVQIVVEVRVASTQIPAKKGRVGRKNSRHIDVTCPTYDKTDRR
jgi:hypothetical protein